MNFPISTDTERRIRPVGVLVVIFACAAIALGPAAAQDVTVETLLAAQEVTSIIAVGDRILAGTDIGGILVMDRDDPSEMERWISGQQLSGNLVKQFAWSGRYYWVATGDNGLTRIDDEGSNFVFRQYLDNLGSRNVTCVTGTVIGGSEIVYYGMFEAGIGKITDGLPGFLYTAEQDGLISDEVNDMQFLGEDLFIATGVGVSRLRDNLFSDQNAGLSNLTVNDFCLDADGRLIAGTNGGVFRWDEAAESWTSLGGIGSWVVRVAAQPDGTLWALGRDSSQNGVLRYRNTGSWVDVGLPHRKCGTLFVGEEVWIGGRVTVDGMATTSGWAYVSRYLPAGGFETWQADLSLVANCEGICFGGDGAAWVGSWGADAISKQDSDGNWSHLYDVAPDGLFNQYANVLCAASDLDGMIWAGQFSRGALRIDPGTMRTEQVTTANSGLNGGANPLLLNILLHPDGPMIFQHDLDGAMVDVLLEPSDWGNTANWISLPTVDVGGIGTAGKVWDAVCESRDVIWFAVEGRGLVRWDVNGAAAGPNDELTWTDFSDDYWADPVTAFIDTNGSNVSDPRAVRGLERAPDGSIWAGGTGLVRFFYDVYGGQATAYEYWREKTASYMDGLLNGSVVDVAVDVNGDAWAATVSGVNRIRHREDGIHIDPFVDLGNYLLYPSYRDLYSPTIVAELPGIAYRKLVADATGERLLLSSDQGAVMLHVQEGYGGVTTTDPSIANVYCYPNPWNPDGEYGTLKLGGFVGDADGDPAEVEVYNLEGQLVFRNGMVEPETGFWTGLNRPGDPVTTGLYLVKISWAGHTITRTLAVVR